jgi:hypothetical protein
MLTSINPLGERARGTRWARTMTWYVTGSVAGGALVGAAAGALGYGIEQLASPSRTAVAVIIAIGCSVALLLELGVGGLRIPTIRRQVNEDWLAVYRGWVYGLGFGLQLGAGVVTVVTTASIYAMILLEACTGSVAIGAGVGAVFGLTRAVPLLGMRRVNEPGELRSVLQRQQAFAPAADGVARVIVATVAAGALVAVVA